MSKSTLDEIAAAIRDNEPCGYMIDGIRRFCDDQEVHEEFRIEPGTCNCRRAAIAALNALVTCKLDQEMLDHINSTMLAVDRPLRLKAGFRAILRELISVKNEYVV